jgi:CSLREA domain-containing protein
MISFLVLGLVQAAPPPAFAKTYDVNKKGDHAPGPCNAADCTLREAILAANARAGPDAIRLHKGTYSLTIPGAPDDETGQVGDLDITDPLRIYGVSAKDTFLEGAWGSRLNSIFHVLQGKTTIEDVTVRKGLHGITVSLSGELVLVHSALRNNGTETTSGGGLFTEGPATVLNAEVTGNKSGDLGGGIYTSAAIEVRNSMVANNTSFSGGGIYAAKGALIQNSVIRDNDATNIGGGIYSQAFLHLTKSTVEKNRADSGGGIVSLWQYEIAASKILGNTARVDGGGLFEWSAMRGSIKRTVLKGNKAKGNGGGIYKIDVPFSGPGCPRVTYTAITLLNNHADSNHDNVGGGGGFHGTCEEGSVYMSNSLIKGNTGFNGGGMFMGLGLAISRSTFAENDSVGHGGGLFTAGPSGRLEINFATFVKNTAGLGGGAIASQGARVGMAASTITGNKAKGYGGGVDVFEGGEATLHYVTVTNNRADSDGTGGEAGGGLQNGGAVAFTLKDSIVSGNSVGSSGTSPDCAGTFASEKSNVIGKAGGCMGFAEPDDLIGGDAGLLPLAWNGGPTRTHALKPSSPAINFGSPSSSLSPDQRGAPRQQLIDSGAYERAKCEGILINVVGWVGNDHLTGTTGADGIFSSWGDDVIKGLGGNDGLCGLEGKDRLEGGDGEDRLNGGANSDICQGGPDPDIYKSCEEIREG